MIRKNMTGSRPVFRSLVAAGVLATLASCGGGSGSSSSAITLSGTTATGAALAGALVSVTCASGTGTVRSDGNGAFSAAIANGAGPCLLSTTGTNANGTTVTFLSLATGGGVANITPLTQLLVDYLGGQAGVAGKDLLSSATGKALLADNDALTKGKAAILVLLAKHGFNAKNADFLSGNLIPGVSDADKDLDNLKNFNIFVNGQLVKTIEDECTSDGTTHPYKPPTGATGATGAV